MKRNFYEPLTGRYFGSTEQEITKVISKFNESPEPTSLSEIMESLGLYRLEALDNYIFLTKPISFEFKTPVQCDFDEDESALVIQFNGYIKCSPNTVEAIKILSKLNFSAHNAYYRFVPYNDKKGTFGNSTLYKIDTILICNGDSIVGKLIPFPAFEN